MDLSIIIVNYNVKYFLEQCLLSVRKAVTGITSEIIVIDNNSTDGSKVFFDGIFKDVKFIWSEFNYGFGKANNLALENATGKYILFLNPDTIVAEDCFKKCIDYFEKNSDTGALGVRMIDGSGHFLKESKRSFPDPITSFYKLSGLTALFPKSKRFAGYYKGDKSDLETNEMDVVAGAFMMIPKIVLNKTGLFDEAFFMYGEDIDLSYRIQKAGFKNIYFAGTTIIHFKGESTSRDTLKYVKLFYKAMRIFVRKHYNDIPSRFYVIMIELAISLRSLLALSFRGGRALKKIILTTNKVNNKIRNLLIVGEISKPVEELLIDSGKYILKYSQGLVHLIKEIKEQNMQSILFCEAHNIHFKTIIELIEVTNINCKILIHSLNSSSILSSCDQHATGEIISLENLKKYYP